MQTTWALLSLVLPGISAFIICQRLCPLAHHAVKILIGLVVYALLHLLPIHAIATLELLQLIDSVSLFKIALLEGLILLGLLNWLHFNNSTEGPSYTAIFYTLKHHTLPMYLIVSIGILVISYLFFAIDLLTSYPDGWDALAYHLPLAVRWLQDGSLAIPFSSHWKFSLPSNAEISMMVLLGTGWQALSSLFNMITAVIFVCASYLIALRYGASRVAAFIAVIILLSIPILQFQVFSNYVDLYGSSFIMAAVALFLYRYETPEQVKGPKWFFLMIALSGLACGIAVGTKPTFYVYAAILLMVVLGVLWVERHRHGQSIASLTALMLVAMLVPSVFWFGRAFFATGNPLYPIQVKVMGITLFEGLSRSEITGINYGLSSLRAKAERLIIYPWTEYTRTGYSYGVNHGFGAIFATFVPLGVVYGMTCLLSNHERERFRTRSVLTLLFLIFLVSWWLVMGQWPRFGLPVISLACVLSTSLFDLFLRSRSRFFGLLFVCSLATTSLLAAFVPFSALSYRIHIGDWTRSGFYGYPTALDSLPQGVTVMNIGTKYYKEFALAGERLTNKVIPRFEVPYYLTEDSLCRRQVDYIVGVAPFPSEALNLIQNLTRIGLILDETTLMAPVKNPWKIWRVTCDLNPDLRVGN